MQTNQGLLSRTVCRSVVRQLSPVHSVLQFRRYLLENCFQVTVERMTRANGYRCNLQRLNGISFIMQTCKNLLAQMCIKSKNYLVPRVYHLQFLLLRICLNLILPLWSSYNLKYIRACWHSTILEALLQAHIQATILVEINPMCWTQRTRLLSIFDCKNNRYCNFLCYGYRNIFNVILLSNFLSIFFFLFIINSVYLL